MTYGFFSFANVPCFLLIHRLITHIPYGIVVIKQLFDGVKVLFCFVSLLLVLAYKKAKQKKKAL